MAHINNLEPLYALCHTIAHLILQYLVSLPGVNLIIEAVETKNKVTNIIFNQLAATKIIFGIQERVNRTYQKDKNGKYKCPLCRKGYKSISGLDEHYNRHDKVNPYKCSCCSKSFPSKGQKYQHVKNNHI